MTAEEIDPSAVQTIEEIGTYYRSAKVGDPACVRRTYGGSLEFAMGSVVREAQKSRIVLDVAAWNGGTSWYVNEKSCGRNCRARGGQARLVLPTKEIAEWVNVHPRGVETYKIRDKENKLIAERFFDRLRNK
jgi:hypothetical protein